MNKTGGTFSKDGDRATQLANVSLLYYGEGLTQSEIAKRMGVSRATVVNLVREARTDGIVEIHINGRHVAENSLSRNLCEAFGLQDAYVSDAFADRKSNRETSLRQLGRVAAIAFLDVVEPGDKIGIAWGETIFALSRALPRAKVPDAEVSQLIGSMISDRVPASETCAIQIANQIGARCFTLHAPAIVSTQALAQSLMAEPTIAAQMERLQSLDMVVYSIGHVSEDTHLVAAGMATADELATAREVGAEGILCCRYINKNGRDCSAAPAERLIATSLENLKTARKKLLVVAGEDRTAAALAAIRGNLVTHLCVDKPLALSLLAAGI